MAVIVDLFGEVLHGTAMMMAIPRKNFIMIGLLD